ncbi:MAG: hypothetical protein GY751_21085 [Bacteroidetes bacterium]|nr:hypothetical protein [Bacteroidota bacterium]
MKRCRIPALEALSGVIVIIATLFVTSCAGEAGSTKDSPSVERAVEHFDKKVIREIRLLRALILRKIRNL